MVISAITWEVGAEVRQRRYRHIDDGNRRPPRPAARAAARLAPAAAHEPARPRTGGGGVRAAPELPRDGPLEAQPGHGAAARRGARGPAARPQPAAAGRRVRTGLRRAAARGAGDG